MNWPGVRPQQYDAVMAQLRLDTDPAARGVLQVASLTAAGLEVCDIWQTQQAVHGLLAQRLLPAAEDVGIDGGPTIRLVPLHNLYAADPHMIDRIGALSMPAAVAAWAA